MTSRFSFNWFAYFFANICMTLVCLPNTSPTFLRVWLNTRFNSSASSSEDILGRCTTPFLIISITCFFPLTTIMARCLSISSILRLSFSRRLPMIIRSSISGFVLFLRMLISDNVCVLRNSSIFETISGTCSSVISLLSGVCPVNSCLSCFFLPHPKIILSLFARD